MVNYKKPKERSKIPATGLQTHKLVATGLETHKPPYRGHRPPPGVKKKRVYTFGRYARS